MAAAPVVIPAGADAALLLGLGLAACKPPVHSDLSDMTAVHSTGI